MKRFILLIFALFLTLTFVFANAEEEVCLKTDNHFFYDNPAPIDEVLEIVKNQERFYNDEKSDFLLDEDFADSKIEKVFCKFINNKIQNGKMNLITAPINY